jgi:hypothetical protein
MAKRAQKRRVRELKILLMGGSVPVLIGSGFTGRAKKRYPTLR